MIIPLHKDGGMRECTKNGDISHLGIPGKVHAECLEKQPQEIIEPKLEDTQCSFVLDVALQTKFSLAANFREIFTCFVDLEKVCDWVPRDKVCVARARC